VKKTNKMSDFKTEYLAYCDRYGTPQRIELLLCDINAVLRGKWLPGDEADKLATGKVRLPLSTYAPNILGFEVEETGLGIVAGDPDGVLVPVPGSLQPVPWQSEPTAQVLVEMLDSSGTVSWLSSRAQLAKVLAQFTNKGWHPVVAAELEFYLLQTRPEPTSAPIPPVGAPEAQNYDMECLARCQPVLDEILSASAEQGLATDTLIAEFGPGQFEVNFHHSDDVLKAADTALLFRRIVRCVAAKHGYEATFMAKPYRDYPGNGMHLHASIVDANGSNIFMPSADAPKDKASETLQAAVAGTLATMAELHAVFAPHMNSLRRFSQNSFAPSAPEWGYDHRGAAVRIPETHGPGARFEHRISGADVNPYLAIAAILGGALFGLETKPELPAPMDATQGAQEAMAESLTSDWLAAVTQFKNSTFAQQLFTEQYHRVFTQVKLDEISAISSEISTVEYRYYLSRF
jgi:glutamine synthetase